MSTLKEKKKQIRRKKVNPCTLGLSHPFGLSARMRKKRLQLADLVNNPAKYMKGKGWIK